MRDDDIHGLPPIAVEYARKTMRNNPSFKTLDSAQEGLA